MQGLRLTAAGQPSGDARETDGIPATHSASILRLYAAQIRHNADPKRGMINLSELQKVANGLEQLSGQMMGSLSSLSMRDGIILSDEFREIGSVNANLFRCNEVNDAIKSCFRNLDRGSRRVLSHLLCSSDHLLTFRQAELDLGYTPSSLKVIISRLNKGLTYWFEDISVRSRRSIGYEMDSRNVSVVMDAICARCGL